MMYNSSSSMGASFNKSVTFDESSIELSGTYLSSSLNNTGAGPSTLNTFGNSTGSSMVLSSVSEEGATANTVDSRNVVSVSEEDASPSRILDEETGELKVFDKLTLARVLKKIHDKPQTMSSTEKSSEPLRRLSDGHLVTSFLNGSSGEEEDEVIDVPVEDEIPEEIKVEEEKNSEGVHNQDSTFDSNESELPEVSVELLEQHEEEVD